MSDYPMLISNKLHSFRNFIVQNYTFIRKYVYVACCFYLQAGLQTLCTDYASR